ncbi:toxin Cry1Ac domain D-VI-related protein, partial [Peribacillus frigoritolerans]|uniref:toxin Cry1Ac domain D-VI-related protein n=1 Tax=Peribacillus frigoritolerans TaxID=450367 RepID=UPI0020C066C6
IPAKGHSIPAEQEEKDLTDAKNKVEDLFTDDKFDTLEGTTDQGAIDEAQEAVNKLPEGAQKSRHHKPLYARNA